MAEGDLRKLWKLHLVDSAIVEIRSRAAALDPGKQILAEIETLNKALEEKGGRAKGLGGELADLELQQKTIADKLKKIDKSLYGGQVVNPREVENLQKEIQNLNHQRASHDDRIMELWDLVPPAKAEAEKVEKAIEAKKAELAEYQKKVVQVKHQLETQFKEKSVQRPTVAKEVPPALLARYEATRQKQSGIGMAQINLKNKSCAGCGMKLPEKAIESAKEDRLATCEGCHRILYFTEGLV
jgi:uncharacterized protein